MVTLPETAPTSGGKAPDRRPDRPPAPQATSPRGHVRPCEITHERALALAQRLKQATGHPMTVDSKPERSRGFYC